MTPATRAGDRCFAAACRRMIEASDYGSVVRSLIVFFAIGAVVLACGAALSLTLKKLQAA